MSPQLLAAITAAVIGPVIAYLGAVRRLSGRIGTSEASKLWDEATEMRREYREDMERTRTEHRADVTRLQGIIDELRTRIRSLENENARLRRRVETRQ